MVDQEADECNKHLPQLYRSEQFIEPKRNEINCTISQIKGRKGWESQQETLCREQLRTGKAGTHTKGQSPVWYCFYYKYKSSLLAIPSLPAHFLHFM